MYICDVYRSSLRFCCQRFCNNSNPEFTDEEVLTVYLFCGYCQRYFGIKEMHTFAKEYLSSWFPKLPSYKTFMFRKFNLPVLICKYRIYGPAPQIC